MDYSEALATLSQSDPMMGKLINQLGDCTLAQEQQTGDLLACLTEAILYQQLSGKAAATIHRRYLDLFSPSLPTAADILQTPDERLRSAGISRPKITYLKDLAAKLLVGLPTLDELKLMDDQAIIQQLTGVKGIGPWTVQMLLIFRLHRWDVLPVDDLGIRAGIRQTYNLAELPDKKTVVTLAQPWQPYRTIACWYLWRCLENKP